MKLQCSNTASAEKEISFGSLHMIDIKKRKRPDFLILQESIFFFKRQHIYNSSKTAKLVYKKKSYKKKKLISGSDQSTALNLCSSFIELLPGYLCEPRT